jgi:hypothetical protein
MRMNSQEHVVFWTICTGPAASQIHRMVAIHRASSVWDFFNTLFAWAADDSLEGGSGGWQ